MIVGLSQFLRAKNLAFSFLLVCLAIPSAIKAQIVDKIIFGDSASESAHGFVGNSAQAGVGQLGQPTRTLMPLNPLGVYGGNMTFTAAVDPSAQNYVTVKFWGNDASGGAILWFKFDGYVNTNWLGSPGAASPGKFFYRTIPIPLWLTRGKTSMMFDLLSLGDQNYYARTVYNAYQALDYNPSQPIYRAYVHTDPFLNPPADDVQAAAPQVPSPAPKVDPVAKIASMEASENTTLKNLLNSSTPLAQAQIEELAMGYTSSWSAVYHNPAVITRVINDTDTAVAAYYGDNGLANSEWGGGFFKIGHAIVLLYSQLQGQLDVSNSYGSGGTLNRRQAWSTALRADVDQSRYNRKSVANQAFAVDTGIYQANKALELIDLGNALPETQAQDYLMQSCGLEYYKGSDLPGGGSDYAEGQNYWMVTPKGDSREGGWVASDYGLYTVTATENYYEMSGNSIFLDRALQMLKTRAHFDYPASGNGGFSMVVADPIGTRNQYIPGRAYYVDIATVGASLDPMAVGYIQQAISDNQLFSPIGLPSVYIFAKYYPIIAAQPSTGVVLPLTPGQPDNAFADELDQIVSIKHGSDSLFLNLFMNDTSITGHFLAFLTSAQTDRTSDVMVDDESFGYAGSWLTGNGLSDSSGYDLEPDNPINSDFGVHTPLSTSLGRGGRATGYTARFGNYLVGMNSDETNSITYTMKLPPGFTGGLDLISGQTLSAPIVLQPQTTVVFYLPSIPSGKQGPSRPTFFTAVPGNAQVSLAWDPPSNASTYNLKRSTTPGGPYTTLASGLLLPSYFDNAVSNGTTYYYIVTAVNSVAESGASYELAMTPNGSGVAFPWAYQTIAATGYSGSATFSGGTATIQTSSYGYNNDTNHTSDDFSLMYQTLAGNGSITARVVSENSGGGNECGLMIRGSLAANSQSASMSVNVAGSGFALQSALRSGDGAHPTVPATSGAVTLPYYLRMVRAGMTISSYASPDGNAWTPISVNLLPAISNSSYLGLAAGRSNTCVFDHIVTSVFSSANSTATSVGVVANPSTQIQGNAVVLEATVAVQSQTIPSGTVSFYDGTTLIATVTPSSSGVADLSVSTLSAGTHSITAAYTGDKTLQSSTSAPIKVVINPLPVPVLTLTSSLNPAPGPGTPVTYTLTATFASPIPKVDGRGYLYDGTTQIYTNLMTWVDSTHLELVYTTSSLAVGSHPLTVFVDGAQLYASETSPVLTEVITATKATNPSVKLSASPTAAFRGANVTLTAKVTGSKFIPSGTVNFMDVLGSAAATTLATVTLDGTGAATFSTANLAAGVHTLSLQYSGDTNFFPGNSSNVTVTISVANSTVTLGATQTALALGAPDTFTANVMPATAGGITPTGTVKFMDGTIVLSTVTLADGAASFTTSTLSGGSHSITATYSGDGNYAMGTSAPLAVTVALATPVLAFSANPTKTTQYAAVTFSLTATPPKGVTVTPTGTVSFYDGTTLIGNAALNGGKATFVSTTLAAGSRSITASYGGDANFNAVVSQPVVVTVANAAPSLSMSATPTSVALGGSVQFSSTATPPATGLPVPTGTITFSYSGSTLGTATLNNGSATFSSTALPAGGIVVTANYSGDANYSSATSPSVTIVVSKATPVPTLTAAPSTAPVGTTIAFGVTVSQPSGAPTPTGTVTFYDGATAIGINRLSNGSTTYSTANLAVGSHSITAIYNGDGNFVTATTAATVVVITRPAPSVALKATPTTALTGANIVFSVATTPPAGGTAAATGSISFLDGSTPVGSANLSGGNASFTISTLAAGVHSITATYPGDANYGAASSATVLVTITAPAKPTPTLSLAVAPPTAALGASVSFSVTAAPPSGTSSTPTGSVALYDGSTSLGTALLSGGKASFSLATLTAGSHSITAAYAGDGTFNAATSSAATVTVNKAAPTLALTANPTTAFQGVTIGFDVAAAQPTGYPTAPTGTVSFYDGTTLLGSAILNAGSASYSSATLSVGTHSVTATYPGDTNFNTATSTAVTVTVTKPTPTIAIAASPANVIVGSSVGVSVTLAPPSGVTSTPSGTISFYEGTTLLGTASVNNGSAAFNTATLTVGSHSITAAYSGDTTFSPATSTATIVTVSKGAAILAFNATPTSATVGATISLSISLTPPSGTSAVPSGVITFFDGTTTLGTVNLVNGAAAFTTANLAAGNHTMSAAYAGDATFDPATSSAVTVTLTQATPSVGLVANPSTAILGAPVSFNITVAPPAGTTATPNGIVTFYDGAAILGTVNLNSGTASFNTAALSLGTHTITASYAGDATFAAAVSLPATVTVTQPTPSVGLSANPASGTLGTAIALSVNVLPPSGTTATPTGFVNFYDAAVLLGSVSLNGGTATFSATTLALGTHAITASYAGDSTFTAVASGTVAVTIVKATPGLSLIANPSVAALGTAISFTATSSNGASAAPTGTVSFYDGGVLLGSAPLTGGQANFVASSLPAGAHSISASYAGDANFNSATSPIAVVTVTQGSTLVQLAANPATATFGTSVNFVAVASAASGIAATPTGSVSFYDGTARIGSATLAAGSASLATGALAVGSHAVTAAYGGDANFTPSTSPAISVTIQKATPALSLSANPTAAASGGTVVFTASFAVSAGVPTGNVTFSDGATQLATVPLSGATATYSTAALSSGVHLVTATYTGDATFNGVVSAAVSVTVAPPPGMDFAISLTPTIPEGTAGQTITETVNIAALNGFNTPVQLSCSAVAPVAQCSFSPATVNPSGSTASSVLTLRLGQLTSTYQVADGMHPGRPLAPVALAGLLGVFLSFANRGLRRKYRRVLFLFLALALTGTVSMVSGCGSGIAQETGTVTVTAVSGATVHVATLKVMVDRP